MAIKVENLIDKKLLTRYDAKIKDWVSRRGSNNVLFTTKANLPVKGEKDVLYVTERSLFTWDGTKYIEITSSQEPIVWNNF